MGMQNKALHCWDYGHRWLFIFRDFIGWIICNINRKSPEGNRTRKNKKIKRSEIRAVLIEAKQPFTMLYKYDLVVPWQCVDIGREVDKVKLIILSKISWNILWQWHYCNNWFMFKRLDYFKTHTNNKPKLPAGNWYNKNNFLI